MTHRSISALTLGAFLVIGGSRALGQAPAYVDASGHHTSFVRTTPDVTLEVLEWAGNGPTVVMLPGVGHTAHVFDFFTNEAEVARSMRVFLASIVR